MYTIYKYHFAIRREFLTGCPDPILLIVYKRNAHFCGGNQTETHPVSLIHIPGCRAVRAYASHRTINDRCQVR
jgi:hypothetical protein